MTREEQRYLKCVKKTLETSIRGGCKRNGFRCIAGFGYRQIGEYLYEILLSAPPVDVGRNIKVLLWCKPLALDDIFWKVFDMADVAQNQPFSFRVQGAFTADCFQLEKWKVPLSGPEEIDQVLEQIFEAANRKMADYSTKLINIEDFKNLISADGMQSLNMVLCDIYIGNCKEALKKIDTMLENHDSGRFIGEDGSIVAYAKRYCEAILRGESL